MSSEFSEPKPHRPSNDPKVKAWEKRKRAWENAQGNTKPVNTKPVNTEPVNTKSVKKSKLTSQQLFANEPMQKNNSENNSYTYPSYLPQYGSSKKSTMRSRSRNNKSKMTRRKL